jgi:L-alanine-DL-glutamate epimerase-like enolase superfamily enzyme
MRITQLESELLNIPLTRPIAVSGSGVERLDHVFLLLVHVDTDSGHRGLGFAYALGGGGRAFKCIAEDDLAPALLGEDPLDHERLSAKIYGRLQGIGRLGLVAQAYSAVDLALWDLKGKVAGVPLYKLLGGARESAPVYAADCGWLWMSPEEIIEASRPYIEQGLMGVKIKVGSADPEVDAERVSRIREALGDDVWLAVDANQRYDYGTALSMGHFFEEEIGADWFEEPISCADVEGHERLAHKLEIPLAAGETLFDQAEFRAYLERDILDIVQPDVTRVGGLTSWLKIAVLADAHHRPLSPHLMPEVAVHLACGLPYVRAVEYMPWFFPAFVEPPALVEGRIVPPKSPGLGLEVRDDAIRKYRVQT